MLFCLQLGIQSRLANMMYALQQLASVSDAYIKFIASRLYVLLSHSAKEDRLITSSVACYMICPSCFCLYSVFCCIWRRLASVVGTPTKDSCEHIEAIEVS